MKWIIPYQGRDWVFDDERLTASEARLQMRLTAHASGAPGMSPRVAEAARQNELHPEAWIAALAIARRRTGLSADEAVQINADDVELIGIANATIAANRPADPEPDPEPEPEPEPVTVPAS